jgi:hypothetical protein
LQNVKNYHFPCLISLSVCCLVWQAVGHDGWFWATPHPDDEKRENGNHGSGEERNMHEGFLDYSVGNVRLLLIV